MLSLKVRKSDKSCNRVFEDGKTNLSLEQINDELRCHSLCMIGQRGCDGIGGGIGVGCKYYYKLNIIKRIVLKLKSIIKIKI